MEVTESADFEGYTLVEQSDSGDGLRISFYEKEGENMIMNLDWDDDSEWSLLNEGEIIGALERMIDGLVSEEEAREFKDKMVLVPIEEWERIEESVGKDAVKRACGVKPENSCESGNDPAE